MSATVFDTPLDSRSLIEASAGSRVTVGGSSLPGAASTCSGRSSSDAQR